MNIVKEINNNDQYESGIICYKCTKIEELIDFIKENEKDLVDLHINVTTFEKDNIYIIKVFDSIPLRSIDIYSVK